MTLKKLLKSSKSQAPHLSNGYNNRTCLMRLLRGWNETWNLKDYMTHERRQIKASFFYHCCLVAKSCLTLLWPHGLARQASLSMGFPKQEYWSELSFPSPGIFANQRSNPHLLNWQRDSLPLSHQGSPFLLYFFINHENSQKSSLPRHSILKLKIKDKNKSFTLHFYVRHWNSP